MDKSPKRTSLKWIMWHNWHRGIFFLKLFQSIIPRKLILQKPSWIPKMITRFCRILSNYLQLLENWAGRSSIRKSSEKERIRNWGWWRSIYERFWVSICLTTTKAPVFILYWQVTPAQIKYKPLNKLMILSRLKIEKTPKSQPKHKVINILKAYLRPERKAKILRPNL